MGFWIGVVLVSVVLVFAGYELAYGGGKPENGRNGVGAAGESPPYW